MNYLKKLQVTVRYLEIQMITNFLFVWFGFFELSRSMAQANLELSK